MKKKPFRKIDWVFFAFLTLAYPLVTGGYVFVFHWLHLRAFYSLSGGTDSFFGMDVPESMHDTFSFYWETLDHRQQFYQWSRLAALALVLLFVLYLVLALPRPTAALCLFAGPFLLSRLLLVLVGTIPLYPGISLGFYGGWRFEVEYTRPPWPSFGSILLFGILVYGLRLLLAHGIAARKKAKEDLL